MNTRYHPELFGTIKELPLSFGYHIIHPNAISRFLSARKQKEETVIVKTPILPGRVRKVPKSFSWIDYQLFSEGHIERCSHAAGNLFLVCVGDDKRLSDYGKQTIMKKLPMDQHTFENARSDLILMCFVAWQKPLYQVLCLEPASEQNYRRTGSIMGLGDILKNPMEVCHD